MVNIQVGVINKRSVKTNGKVQSSLPTLKTQRERDRTPSRSSGGSERILCSYVNASSKIQIARIANTSNCDLERVVFPGQRLLFEALPDAQLEIHTGVMATAFLSDKILCKHLRVALQ
jgi:hypothetical protein